MRIVHLFKDFYPPITGGIEQHMRLLCAGLASKADVSVLVPSRLLRRTEEAIDGVRVVRTPELGRWLSTPLCPGMASELRRLSPDLVHLHFPSPAGDLAYLVSGCRAPVVMTYHADVVRQRPVLWAYRPVFKRLSARVRRIIVSSHEYLASSTFLPPYRDRCAVIPFGVDVDSFTLERGEQQQVQEVRRRHGNRLVVFLGVLRYYKGLDVLVRAMTSVPGHLLVVGSGTQRAPVERLARRLGLVDRVTFTGQVSDPRRRVVLHAADVFVLPSTDRSEAFGIAQLEAMACGKPVVGSDLPTGVRAVNHHGVTGLLVPPRDPDALAQALNTLLDDDALRASLGRAARQRVEREFTAERMVSDTLSIYDDVLAREREKLTA
jgi:glycosyltransferase involved in cell wall biosynthesis